MSRKWGSSDTPLGYRIPLSLTPDAETLFCGLVLQPVFNHSGSSGLQGHGLHMAEPIHKQCTAIKSSLTSGQPPAMLSFLYVLSVRLLQ